MSADDGSANLGTASDDDCIFCRARLSNAAENMCPDGACPQDRHLVPGSGCLPGITAHDIFIRGGILDFNDIVICTAHFCKAAENDAGLLCCYTNHSPRDRHMVSISVAFEDGLPAFYSHTCRAASHFYYVVIGISVIRTAASDKVVDLGRIADVYFIGNGIACGIIVDPAAAQISHLTAAYRCDIFCGAFGLDTGSSICLIFNLSINQAAGCFRIDGAACDGQLVAFYLAAVLIR